MRNRKRRMENFTFYDYREICTHLEQMVQKGWMLKRIGLFWEYERIEPARLHFAVSHCRGIKEEIEEKDGAGCHRMAGSRSASRTVWESTVAAGRRRLLLVVRQRRSWKRFVGLG